MASLLAQSQLSKSLSVDAPGVVAAGPTPIPIPMQNPPPQQPFPDYALGYDPTADVKFITQEIPAQPTDGQHSPHPFNMLSDANLHPILFQLETSPSLLNDVEVPLLINEATNQVERGHKGRQLRYFSHLPRWISHNVSGMLMELWLRLDPRLDTSDIMARIYLPAGMRMPLPNSFNMRRLRYREYIRASPFTVYRQHPSATDVRLISKRTREQLLLNTCMVVDLPNNRLLKPVLKNDKSIAGYVDSRLPLDYFLSGFPTPVPIPSDQQMVALELRKRMQTLALRRGLGGDPEDYRRVPTDLHPPWWHKGAARDVVIADIDNKTHYQWIEERLEEYPGLTRRTTLASSAQSSAHPPQAQPQLPPLLPAVNPPQPTTAGSTLMAQQAPIAPIWPIDPRLSGTEAAALRVAYVAPEHFTNAEGGTSYYVEAAHWPEYATAEAAHSQEEAEGEAH